MVISDGIDPGSAYIGHVALVPDTLRRKSFARLAPSRPLSPPRAAIVRADVVEMGERVLRDGGPKARADGREERYHRPHTQATVEKAVDDLFTLIVAAQASHVTIETVRSFHPGALPPGASIEDASKMLAAAASMGTHIMRAKDAAQELKGRLWMCGIPVSCLTVGEARKKAGIKVRVSASSTELDDHLDALIIGWRACLASMPGDAPHLRDAAVCALVPLMDELRPPAPAPPPRPPRAPRGAAKAPKGPPREIWHDPETGESAKAKAVRLSEEMGRKITAGAVLRAAKTGRDVGGKPGRPKASADDVLLPHVAEALRLLRETPTGLTATELSEATGEHYETADKALRVHLGKRGLAATTGEKRGRGKVWVATQGVTPVTPSQRNDLA